MNDLSRTRDIEKFHPFFTWRFSMFTATLTPAATRSSTPMVQQHVEEPPKLPSMLHDLLWFIEMDIQRTGVPPSLKMMRRAFHVSRAAVHEMVRLLQENGLVQAVTGSTLLIQDLTELGRDYCYLYPPD
jgi:hypothetical protein